MEALGMLPDCMLRDFNWFLEHQDELVRLYDGKFIVIKDGVVIGSYDDQFLAARETSKTHPLGTFVVQRCEAGPECYTVTLYSPHVLAPVT
jgi:hypothetical protein